MDLGKSSPSRVLVSEEILSRASTPEASRWEFGHPLRGHPAAERVGWGLGRQGSRRFRLGLNPLTA
jgi:hypothetical protein